MLGDGKDSRRIIISRILLVKKYILNYIKIKLEILNLKLHTFKYSFDNIRIY